MPLVVSSLMGDASDVFDWILSLNPGNTQDLTTLLQMLREHYCGSLTFREQRNTIENLCKRPQEAAIDILIRVGTSVSNLGKDWKDELTEKELQSLQYEVSLNGVQEEIRHVLDSEVAKNGGKLTPQQMYEAVKKYETYVACNKRLEGKGASSSTSQQKATGHTSGYRLGSIKPQLLLPQWPNLRTTAITFMSPFLMKEPTPLELSHLRKMTRGYSFPAIWRRLYLMTLPCRLKWPVPCGPRKWRPEDALPVTSQVIFKGTIGNMRKKMGLGPCSRRGLPKTSQLKRGQSQNPLSQVEPCPKQILQSEESPVFEPRCFLYVHRPQEFG